MKMKISIITPAYNRVDTLLRLYQSLLSQTNKNFEWILIDDGSTDNTDIKAREWIAESKIEMKYYKQVNQGLVQGFSMNPTGDYTLVLDSDDFLADTAIENIIYNINSNDEYIGVVGLKSYTNNKIVGTEFKEKENTYLNLYYGNNRVKGDKLFVIKTNLYRNGIVSPLNGEKYMPDNVPFLRLNGKGKYIFINKILYYGDYLQDGMTQNVKKLVMKNINSYIYEKNISQKLNFKIFDKCKINIQYIFYSLLAGNSFLQIYNSSYNKLFTLIFYIPSVLYFLIMRKKYLIK